MAKKIFLKYQYNVMDKCLLIFDMASSHISESSLDLLKKLNINYLTIPSGMTSYCQPLDISVNKIFKDNKRILFEKNRLFMIIIIYQ